MRLEVVAIPVSDVDRAKEFYGRFGWRLDGDFTAGGGRVIQYTRRHRHPRGARRAGAARRRGERGVPLCRLQSRGPRWTPERPLSGAAQLWVLLSFSDLHGNHWLVQQITTRLPGRVDVEATTNLASALRRAAAAHGEHENRTGGRDENWPDWYAAYMVAEETGTELPA